MTEWRVAMTENKTESKDERNILQRINAVMKEVAYLKKDGVISFGDNTYPTVTHDAVTAAIRPHMVKHGIVLQTSLIEEELFDLNQFVRDDRHSAKPITKVKLLCRLVNIDNPTDFVDGYVVGYGQDSGDKGIGKAISYAVKYFLLKQFCLETGENEESRSEMEKTISDEDYKRLSDMLKKSNTEDDQFVKFLNKNKGCGISSLSELKSKDLQYALAALKKKIKMKEKSDE